MSETELSQIAETENEPELEELDGVDKETDTIDLDTEDSDMFTDEEDSEEGDSEEDDSDDEMVDLGSILINALETEEGDTVCTALVKIADHLAIHNKLMYKILKTIS